MSDSINSKEAIVIERTFDASIDLIWQLWTQPEHLKNWYGPQGFTIHVAEMDVRVGGKRLIRMDSPDGSMTYWTTGEFTELVENERLAYTDIPCDENGTPMPMENGQTLTTIVTVALEDLGGRTKMVMSHAGLPAGEEGANEGWNQAFIKMADHLETLLKNK